MIDIVALVIAVAGICFQAGVGAAVLKAVKSELRTHADRIRDLELENARRDGLEKAELFRTR